MDTLAGCCAEWLHSHSRCGLSRGYFRRCFLDTYSRHHDPAIFIRVLRCRHWWRFVSHQCRDRLDLRLHGAFHHRSGTLTIGRPSAFSRCCLWLLSVVFSHCSGVAVFPVTVSAYTQGGFAYAIDSQLTVQRSNISDAYLGQSVGTFAYVARRLVQRVGGHMSARTDAAAAPGTT